MRGSSADAALHRRNAARAALADAVARWQRVISDAPQTFEQLARQHIASERAVQEQRAAAGLAPREPRRRHRLAGKRRLFA
jgi:hypothetical protein